MTLPKKISTTDRQHTGTFAGDRMQRTAQRAASALNKIRSHVSDVLETDIATLVSDLAALAARVLSLETIGWGPFGRVGRHIEAMGNANQTLTAEESKRAYIRATGAHTAIRTLTLTATAPANDDDVFMHIFNNATTGGFAITIAASWGGATVNVPAAGTNIMGFSSGGVFLVL